MIRSLSACFVLMTIFISMAPAQFAIGTKGRLRERPQQENPEPHQNALAFQIRGQEKSLLSADSSLLQKTLAVRFEGNDIPNDVVLVLKAFVKLNLIKLKGHKILRNEIVSRIYTEKLNFPFWPDSMKSFADDLNRRNTSFVKPGETVKYPDVRFSNYRYSLKFDKSDPQENVDLNSILKDWAKFVVRVQRVGRVDTNIVAVILTGYQLKIQFTSDSSLKQAVKALSDLKRKNTRWFINSNDPNQTKYHSGESLEKPCSEINIDNARRFWSENLKSPDEAKANTQGWLGNLVGMPGSPCMECPKDNCPEIVLIDQQVDLHPNLLTAIKNKTQASKSDTSEPVVHDGKYKFKYQNGLDKDKDHGTHLAGIMASRATGFGFIGINPNAQIYSLNWLTYQNKKEILADTIDNLETSGIRHIYVFANQWQNEQFKSEDKLHDGLTQKFDKHLLLISAAGNEGRNIQMSDNVYPMILGDLENVIVVTACEDCDYLDDPKAAKLLQVANYSTQGYVHLAAPGNNIPSTISDGRYASASGTSQAVAIVAGVASVMMSQNKDYYSDAYKIKTRLQITARPFWDTNIGKKIASGILDAKVALLDPKKNWIKIKGQDIRDKTCDFCEFTKPVWLTDDFKTINLETKAPGISIPVKNIYRIINEDNKFWIYYKPFSEDSNILEKQTLGIVKRAGPLGASPQNSDLLIKIEQNGQSKSLKIQQISDLILNKI